MMRRFYLRFWCTTIKTRDQNPQNISNKKQQQNKKQPKRRINLVKLRRKQIDHEKIVVEEPSYKNYQHQTQTQKKYQKAVEEKIQSNLATHNFYKYQLERGQDLIDDIPVDPYYEYRLSDLKNQLQGEKNKIKKNKMLVDPSRLQKLRNVIFSYQTIKHQYQVQQFYKKLKQYPGSIKGSNPQDDPEAFSKYAYSIMTEYVKAQVQLDMKSASAKVDKTKQSEKYTKMTNITNVTDYLGDNRSVQPLVNENKYHLNVHGSNKDTQEAFVVQYSDVPQLPYTQFQQYHSYIQKMKMWSKFRQYYDSLNRNKRIEQVVQAFDQIQKTRTKRQGKKHINLKPSIYSLYTYYKTLPKEMQEHPGVRTVYLGLQYSQPDIPYEEKEQILNKACQMALPLDKFSDAAMEQLLGKKKQYLTPHLTDRIFNMNPQFTWDIHQFLTQVKDQKLRSISTVKEKQQSFPEPPQTQHDWQEGMANLPVDFYDNDDGFWDDHINEKLKRYEKVKPLSKKQKKHFIH